ncbi:Gfo/Idh/MocA family oxidoreductase [Lysinibacillus sp. 1P01SD]|uniref:Gfo/Idh/MocA family oxidoreductase n=1 Tax=Lysinibacillus sp. 1P01SD TaxID=3132285 RepID=UPI00399FFB68
MDVLLVGAGNMAKCYAEVLKDLNVKFEVIGRSENSANLFEAATGIPVIRGGIEQAFDRLTSIPDYAIVATNVENLEVNSKYLIKKGIKNILIEKPGAFTYKDISSLFILAQQMNSNVYIGYNRRFYSSILEVQKRIEQEGGLTSFFFEFNEWAYRLNDGNRSIFKLNNWFIANSTHVVDTAFFLGGIPKEIKTITQSHIDWHPRGSVFVGAGITKKEILFSYHANWNSPGSWNLELMTKSSRYLLRPFEKLKKQKIGNLNIEAVELDDSLDIRYKPGVFRQTEAFLYGGEFSENLLCINEATELFLMYEKINGGL